MPVLVHLAPEKALRSIRKVGIKAYPSDGWGRLPEGVFCMPVLRDYYVSYQWLRELRRGRPGRLYGVQFRVPDGEPVLVGHYGQEKVATTVGEAIGILMRQPDPRGYEFVLPRAVGAKEIHRVIAVRQVMGWRFSPGAKGTRPCTCDYCQRGKINSRRIQGPREPRSAPKAELMRKLHAATTPKDIVDVLYELDRRVRGHAEELRPLMRHPDARVVEKLAETLRYYRGPMAKRMLRELCAVTPREDWYEWDVEEVRKAAATSLVERMREGARPYLGKLAEDRHVREVLDAYDQERAELRAGA